jgi:DNA repair protein RadA/Sms
MEQKPSLMIVDSIQSMASAEGGERGSPHQVKLSAAILTEAAKKSHVPLILVGQVTKEGDLAGPRLLEHMVDTVCMLEGDRGQALRFLRLVKHRFGNTDERAVLQMGENGLEIVKDPSAHLLAYRPAKATGNIVTCLLNGSRPILVEIQALVTAAGYGTPSRRSSGIEANRLSLIIAVLSRRAGINLLDQDVFVNAVGGIEAKDPSIDLAIALALASAKIDKPLLPHLATWGELGLSGEIRPVPGQITRFKEAQRLGYTDLIVPEIPTGMIATPSTHIVKTVAEAICTFK